MLCSLKLYSINMLFHFYLFQAVLAIIFSEIAREVINKFLFKRNLFIKLIILILFITLAVLFTRLLYIVLMSAPEGGTGNNLIENGNPLGQSNGTNGPSGGDTQVTHPNSTDDSNNYSSLPSTELADDDSRCGCCLLNTCDCIFNNKICQDETYNGELTTLHDCCGCGANHSNFTCDSCGCSFCDNCGP